jgi:hypothetical protein
MKKSRRFSLNSPTSFEYKVQDQEFYAVCPGFHYGGLETVACMDLDDISPKE